MQTSTTTSAAAEFDANAMFRKLFVPIDFSPGAQRALVTALTLQQRFGSEVHLFRLTQSSENDQFLAGTGADGLSSQELVTRAEERLRRFVENVLPGCAGDVIVHANVGADVIHGVARAARHIGATLALIPAESRQRVFRTTTEKLVLELDCPVLLVGDTAA